ncbi:MAG: PaaX domain-containing protein, C- domain protein [Acidimicrobiales bacterium]
MKQERNVPLTARSVLASTLLGAEPPLLPVAYLLHVADLFGINENRARVALSRMVASGEADTDGDGRYRLAGHLLDRQARQQASRAGLTRAWSGRWRMVVVTTAGSPAEVRAARRRALSLARLGELREGVWLRPDNLDNRLDPSVAPDVVVFGANPEGDQSALAASLWDLGGWSGRAAALVAAMDELVPVGPGDLAAGFELSAAVLRHFQADPLLPDELSPDGWPGDALRRRYRAWDGAYRTVLDQTVRVWR